MGILCICLYYIILDQLHNFKLQILFFLNNHLLAFDEQTLKISNKISSETRKWIPVCNLNTCLLDRAVTHNIYTIFNRLFCCL